MKKALKIIVRILLIVIVLVIMVAVGVVGAIKYENWKRDKQEVITPSGDIIRVDHNGEQIELEKNVTCLFMGVNGPLTDFIMLGQYNPNTRQINLMSIPRDTKVEGTVDGKINSAYAGVDPTRTVKKVEEITDVSIDYYVLFKTKLLRDLVDAMDGVTVTVPINMNYDDPAQNLYIHLKKGTYKLTGKQAEQFCRFRKNNDGTGYVNGDVDRVKAQQSFIKAMISRCLEPQNLLKVGTFLEIIMENTKTNLTMEILKEYVDDALAFKPDRVRTETLPGAGGYASNGVSYFFMDKEKAGELIKEMFKKETTIEDIQNMESGDVLGVTASGEKIRLEVLNNGTSGKIFSTVVETLNHAGYDVVRVGNYTGESDEYSKIINYHVSTESLEAMEKLSEIVGIKKLENANEANAEVNFTILLGPKYEL